MVLLRVYPTGQLAGALCALAMVAACSSGGGASPSTGGPAAAAGSVPQATVALLATSLHDGLAARRDVTEDVADLFRWMGVPVLGDADGALVDAHRASGTFFALDVQASVIAGALAEGATFDLEDVVTAIAAAGFGAVPSGPLTVDYLSGLLAPAATASTLAPEDQPLALLTALGRERARRSSGGITDPLWGDRRIDLLQFSILDYLTSTPPPAGATAPVVTAFMPTSLTKSMDEASRKAARGLRRFLFETRPPSEGVCEQMLRAGLRVGIAVTPEGIAKPDAPAPNQAQATAVVSFEAKPGVQARAAPMGCALPANGTYTSRALVTWNLDPALASHATLQPAASEVSLIAEATITATADLTPPALRITRLHKTGEVSASAMLATARHPALAVVRSQAGGALLTVYYYEPPPYLTASFFVQLVATGVWERASQWIPADELRTQWRGTGVRLDLDRALGLYRATLAYVGPQTPAGQQWGLQRTYTGTCRRLLGETSPPAGFQVMATGGTAGDLVVTFALMQPGERWEDRSVGVSGGGTITCGAPTTVNSPGSALMTEWMGNHYLPGPPASVGVAGVVATQTPGTFRLAVERDLSLTSAQTLHESSDFELVVPP